MSEYLVVEFPHKRSVLINGEFMGYTNTLLELDGRMYIVTLVPPQGATPAEYRIDLRNTSAFDPMIIRFTEV